MKSINNKAFQFLLKIIGVLFIVLIATNNLCTANTFQKQIDSLEQVVKTTKKPTELFKSLYALAFLHISQNSPSSANYVKQINDLALELNSDKDIALAKFLSALYLDEINEKDSALIVYESITEQLKKDNNLTQLAQSYCYMGGIQMQKGDFVKAIELYKLSQTYATAIKDEHTQLNNLTYLGVSYNQIANYPEAIVYFQKASKLAETLNSNERQGIILMYLGSAYDDSANKDYAMQYYKRSIQLAKKLNDTALLIDAEIYLGNGYYYQKNYTKAIEVYKNVCSMSENKSDKIVAYAGALGNLGNAYTDIGKIKESQEYQYKAVQLFEQLKDIQGLSDCYIGIGKNFHALKQYDKSIEFFNKAIALGKEMESLETLREAYHELALAYEGKSDINKAYQYFKLFHQFNDSIYNTSNTKKMTELEMNFRFDAQEKENQLIQKNKEELSNQQLKHQKIVSYVSILGILILGVLIIVVYRNSNQRKQTNKELRFLNEDINLKNKLIQEKNNEITGSINYAKRIQSSFLTSETYIKQRLTNHFILFTPRDIVSGDFYWVAEKNNNLYICTADCTGHGIPGAFMSLISMSILNEIIHSKNNIKHSDEILNELRNIIIMALNPEGANEEGKDGLDAVICRFDFQKMELEYSAANNPFYIIRQGILLEFKADKMPVGKYINDEKPFTRHLISIEKDDCIYTFSDGYADQFGGPNGKKFKYAPFKELLLEIHNEPMHKQKQLLKERFNSWKGNVEQVDDVCVIGIRV